MVVYKNKFVVFNYNSSILNIKILKEIPDEIEWKETINILKSFFQSIIIKQIPINMIIDIKLLGILKMSYYFECSKIFTDDRNSTKKIEYAKDKGVLQAYPVHQCSTDEFPKDKIVDWEFPMNAYGFSHPLIVPLHMVEKIPVPVSKPNGPVHHKP